MFFRFLQVRHALQSQFGASVPNLESVTLAGVILDEDPKKLTSTLYNQLLLPSVTSHAYQLKSKWEGDLGGLEDEEWEEILSSCKRVSPKLSDRLTHLYILHRSYLTPSRLCKYKQNTNPTSQMRKRRQYLLSLYHNSTGRKLLNFSTTAWALL